MGSLKQVIEVPCEEFSDEALFSGVPERVYSWLSSEIASFRLIRGLTIESALEFQRLLLEQLSSEGHDLTEYSLKSQLDRLVEDLIGKASKVENRIKGLAFFDWDKTQYFVKFSQSNILTVRGWAIYFKVLREQGILVSVQYQHDLKIIQKVLDSFFVQIWKFYIGIIVCHKSMMCAL